jgi:hypothetical protein
MKTGSKTGPLGGPLLRGGGERRVDRISDLRVAAAAVRFNLAYSRDAFMLLEPETTSSSGLWG